jgi:hypothetical protein
MFFEFILRTFYDSLRVDNKSQDWFSHPDDWRLSDSCCFYANDHQNIILAGKKIIRLEFPLSGLKSQSA